MPELVVDDQTPPTAPAAPDTRFYSQEQVDDMLNKARTQERDKLYPKLQQTDAMADELKALKASQKKLEKLEEDRQAAIEAERKKAEDAKLTAEQLIARREQEMNDRFLQFQQDQEVKVALLQKQNELIALQAYIQRRVNEEQDNIVPELIDFIGGDNEAAVEASIEIVKAKSAQIVDNVKQANTRQRSTMPGVAPAAGVNAQGPLDTPGDRQLTAQDIQGMSMSEFAQLRQRIGMPNGSGRGLFD
jgi:hypothetical protein